MRTHLSAALLHHRRRAGQCHSRPVDADLRYRLFLSEDGPGSSNFSRVVCNHDVFHRDSNATVHAPRANVRLTMRHRGHMRRWIGVVLLTALTIAFVFPILWMLTSSFQSGDKMFALGGEWIPSQWHPENFPNALSRTAFPLYFFNSAVISLVVTASNLIFCTLAGYGLAKFRFPGDRFVLLAILSTLMLPIEVTLVPTFLVVHKFDWINTYQGIAGPLLIDAFGIFLM